MKNNYAHVAICILNYYAWPMPYHFRRLHKLATWQRSDFISLNIKYLYLCVWFCSLVVHPLYLFSSLPCSSKEGLLSFLFYFWFLWFCSVSWFRQVLTHMVSYSFLYPSWCTRIRCICLTPYREFCAFVYPTTVHGN